MKILKILGLFLLFCLIASGLYFKALTSGWLTDKQSPAEAAKLIVPHMQVFKPAGEGPFPTVLMFHGCGGDSEQQIAWGKAFQSWGYAAVYVDSYAGRGIDFDRAISHVCQGRQLIGAERAGDVLSAVAWASQQTWVNMDALTVAGWSHGGWSVMDAFALDAVGELPHGLAAKPKADLNDIDNLILFYPYCGLGDKTTSKGWKINPSTLAITVAVDTVVGNKVCDENFASIETAAPRFQHEVFAGVDHAFDTDAATTRTKWEYRTPKVEALAATEKAQQIVKRFLAPSQ